MKVRISPSAVTLLFVLVLACSGRAETFYAYLTGAQEVPAVSTSATGYARIVLNESAGTISFTVVFNGLSSTQTASHIHTGAIGVSGPVTINFGAVGGTSGTITGSAAITAAQITTLRSHGFYVNVHSSNNPGGELRGQLGIKRPVDFDGDGRQDYSVLRFPSSGTPAPITWWNRNSTTGTQFVSSFGDANTDFPTPGDYDGDGKDDVAIYRAGATAGAQSFMWILKSSDSTVFAIQFGLNGDQIVNRDYDGDGITDLAVFRPGASVGALAFWWIRRSTIGFSVPGQDLVIQFGTTGDNTTSADAPVPGDYDGDGKFDLAVYRWGSLTPANTFIVRRSSDLGITYQPFGSFSTDYVVPGDYDGDGKYDFAVARTGALGTSPLVWWILQSSTGTTRVRAFGRSSDSPAQGDYDGDARCDIAVYRPGATGAQSNFWVLNSLTDTDSTVAWGVGGDFAVNTFDIR